MAGSKRGIEAGRAYVRASLDDSMFIKGLRKMKGGLAGFGRALPSIASGIYIFKQLGSVVSGVGSRIMESIGDVATLAKTAKAFGATAEAASGLFGVFKASGSENPRENIESLVTLSGRIQDVLSGTGKESQKLFEGLSVSAAELAGLPIDEQFFRLHEAIMQLPDPMDRVNRLMLAFGEDGGKTLIGTLSMSTEELRKQAKGYEISAKEAEDASRAQAAMRKVTEAVAKAWQKVALTVAPVIVQLVDGFFKAVHWVSEWVRQNAALQASLDVLKTILAAMGAGAWAASFKVGVAAVKLAFAEAVEWIRRVWLEATTFLASSFVDMSASIESAWAAFTANLKTSLVTAFAAAVTTVMDLMTRWFNTMWGLAESMARNAAGMYRALGLDAMADKVEGIANTISGVRQGVTVGVGAAGAGISAAAGATVSATEDEAARRQQEIEERRRQEQQTLDEDAERTRESLGAESAAAAEELAAAMEHAKEETEKRTEAEVAAPPPTPGPTAPAAVKADNAVNTAAILGTSGAAEAILRAVTGVREDGAEGAVKDLHKTAKDQLKEQKEMRKRGLILAEAKTK